MMFQVVFEMHRVQRRRVDDLDDWILRQYREMYDAFFEERGLIPEGQFLVAVIGRFLGRAFFEERGLIPEGQFHEVGYEELEKDPVGQVRRVYEALNLPEFGPAEPGLRRYVGSIAGYQKNEFPDLPADLRSRIAASWRACFEEWGYPA